jgi:hypothetical protein
MAAWCNFHEPITSSGEVVVGEKRPDLRDELARIQKLFGREKLLEDLAVGLRVELAALRAELEASQRNYKNAVDMLLAFGELLGVKNYQDVEPALRNLRAELAAAQDVLTHWGNLWAHICKRMGGDSAGGIIPSEANFDYLIETGRRSVVVK